MQIVVNWKMRVRLELWCDRAVAIAVAESKVACVCYFEEVIYKWENAVLPFV